MRWRLSSDLLFRRFLESCSVRRLAHEFESIALIISYPWPIPDCDVTVEKIAWFVLEDTTNVEEWSWDDLVSCWVELDHSVEEIKYWEINKFLRTLCNNLWIFNSLQWNFISFTILQQVTICGPNLNDFRSFSCRELFTDGTTWSFVHAWSFTIHESHEHHKRCDCNEKFHLNWI